LTPNPRAEPTPDTAWLRQSLEARLADEGLAQIVIHQTLASTNTELMQAPFASLAHAPVLSWALQQTAGKGRRGRIWQSDSDQALTFSVAFEIASDPSLDLPSLSPAVGLKLAQALSEITPAVKVKWPNDLWRENHKLAGILLEATLKGKIQRVVMGVGINLYWPKADRANPLDSPAAASEPGEETHLPPKQAPGGLFDQAASPTQRLEVLALSVKTLLQVWRDLTSANARPHLRFQDWSRFDALHQAEIQIFSDGHCVASGVNLGVDEGGALLMQCDDSEAFPSRTVRRFDIGEVSLRAKPSAQSRPGPSGYDNGLTATS
jgi:BirA family transcriptional regulator, biotin operon repressor / biotin---[acetyl-CoA-carboxylase] ligase